MQSPWHAIRTPETVLSLLAPRRPIQGAHCTHAGCREADVFRCAYRDRAGSRCETHWCRDHGDFYAGAPFCRRHAAVMRVLVPTQGTLVEMKMLPMVDDRALTLVERIAAAIGDRVMPLLHERFATDPSVRFAADLVPREHTPRHTRASWERGWTCYDHRGYRTRVSVRMPVRTAIVQLVLNDIPIVGELAPPPDRLAGFADDLVDQLREALFAHAEEDIDAVAAVPPAATALGVAS